MAKATKTVANVPNLKDDTALIVTTFSNAYSVEDSKADVIAALIRRATDATSFNLIRIASCVAWLERKGHAKSRAVAMMDKTLQAPTGIIKGKEKRTEAEQRDYKTAGAHWSDFLASHGVESANASKARKGPRKPRVPNGPPASDKSPSPANTVSAPPAPIAPQAFVATKLPTLNDVTAQIGAIVASLSQVGKANVANLKGDKGAAIRDLIAHNVAALKAIEALEG
jgi:hypothetical protein